MLFLFCVLPLVTLLVFHTRLCKCLHKYRLLCEVVKVFQKHFKDGSGETSDLRSFSGLYFAFQIVYVVVTGRKGTLIPIRVKLNPAFLK